MVLNTFCTALYSFYYKYRFQKFPNVPIKRAVLIVETTEYCTYVQGPPSIFTHSKVDPAIKYQNP